MVDSPAVITQASHDIRIHEGALVIIQDQLAERLRFVVAYQARLPQPE
jgi:hypothetical protein